MQIHNGAAIAWPSGADTEAAIMMSDVMSDTVPEQAAQTVAISTASSEAQVQYHLIFTGTGKEYFRIWIVNLCLSMATLGIYSAWAKVRRLKYFDCNTQLNGAAFNFHGNPMTIFRGRAVVVILLFCYHYLFTFSKAFALSLFFIFLLGMPFMMRSALQFRLRNTSYRGLRFQFHGSMPGAFVTYAPICLMLLMPALTGVLTPHRTSNILASFIPYLSWPWLHARMRMYQHKGLGFAQLKSDCGLGRWSFFMAYFSVGLSLLILVMLFGMGSAIFLSSFKNLPPQSYGALIESYAWLLIPLGALAILLAYLLFLSGSAMVQVKVWNKSWSTTRFPGVEIESHLPYKAYYLLQVKNFILTLLTLGLYRPFAVVNVYRLRLQYVALKAAALEQLLATQQTSAVQTGQAGQASGDSSADLFGFDLSW